MYSAVYFFPHDVKLTTVYSLFSLAQQEISVLGAPYCRMIQINRNKNSINKEGLGRESEEMEYLVP